MPVNTTSLPGNDFDYLTFSSAEDFAVPPREIIILSAGDIALTKDNGDVVGPFTVAIGMVLRVYAKGWAAGTTAGLKIFVTY